MQQAGQAVLPGFWLTQVTQPLQVCLRCLLTSCWGAEKEHKCGKLVKLFYWAKEFLP